MLLCFSVTCFRFHLNKENVRSPALVLENPVLSYVSEQNSQKILIFWFITVLLQSSPLFALAWSIAWSVQEKPYYTRLHFKSTAMVIWLCWGWDQSKLCYRIQIINFDFTDQASSLQGSFMNDGPHQWTLTLRISPYVLAQGWFTSFIQALLEWKERMVRWLVIH